MINYSNHFAVVEQAIMKYLLKSKEINKEENRRKVKERKSSLRNRATVTPCRAIIRM